MINTRTGRVRLWLCWSRWGWGPSALGSPCRSGPCASFLLCLSSSAPVCRWGPSCPSPLGPTGRRVGRTCGSWRASCSAGRRGWLPSSWCRRGRELPRKLSVSLSKRTGTHGGGSSCGLVGHHASHGSPEHPGGSAVVDEGPAWVGQQPLAQELWELHLVPKQWPTDVDGFASHNHYSLSCVIKSIPFNSCFAT